VTAPDAPPARTSRAPTFIRLVCPGCGLDIEINRAVMKGAQVWDRCGLLYRPVQPELSPEELADRRENERIRKLRKRQAYERVGA
jgi:hypothetical protein